MSTTTHAGPGGQPAVNYQVIESQIVQGESPEHAAVVGRSNDGIHLLLTPDAAQALATVLDDRRKDHDNLVAGVTELVPLVDLADLLSFDTHLWAHIAVDLTAARALALNANTLGQDVVYATAHQSGYIEPRPKRRLEIVTGGYASATCDG